MEKRIWQDIKDWLIQKEQEFHPSNNAITRIVILVLYLTHKIIESYSIPNNGLYRNIVQNWLNNLFKRFEIATNNMIRKLWLTGHYCYCILISTILWCNHWYWWSNILSWDQQWLNQQVTKWTWLAINIATRKQWNQYPQQEINYLVTFLQIIFIACL